MKNNAIEILQRSRKKVLEQWNENQLRDGDLRQERATDEEHGEQSKELLGLLVSSLNDTNFSAENPAGFDQLFDLLRDISIKRARQGFSPRETGMYLYHLKEALLSVIAMEIADKTVLYDQSLKIDKLIDNLTVSTFETYIKGREEIILRQTDEMDEISTPVIKVWEGILALPIIGTLDSARTQTVMENLLQELVESESQVAILDISGVPSVDSMVAQHLIKTVSATRLMGAECIISGIRPEIAQTIVHLGIDLSDIITKPTLAEALKAAFKMLQVEVLRKKRN